MTVSLDTSLAPGCFGSPIIFKGDGPICSACPFLGQCAPRSQARREALQVHYGIKAPVARAMPLPVSEGGPSAVNGTLVNVRAAELLADWERRGITVTDKLMAGVNPFATGFMRFICHVVLGMGETQCVTREALIGGLTKHMKNWGRETAAAHVTNGLQALKALGCITDNNGQISMKRNQ